jgi:hypothetical protein
MDLVPAISVRENERGREIGAGWDPHWHQPTDLYATFTDKDFRLGLNAAQTTLGAIARLTGAVISHQVRYRSRASACNYAAVGERRHTARKS